MDLAEVAVEAAALGDSSRLRHASFELYDGRGINRSGQRRGRGRGHSAETSRGDAAAATRIRRRYYTKGAQPCEGRFKRFLADPAFPRVHGDTYQALFAGVRSDGAYAVPA